MSQRLVVKKLLPILQSAFPRIAGAVNPTEAEKELAAAEAALSRHPAGAVDTAARRRSRASSAPRRWITLREPQRSYSTAAPPIHQLRALSCHEGVGSCGTCGRMTAMGFGNQHALI